MVGILYWKLPWKFKVCLRCIYCCKTFIVVLINTIGHFVASYFATIVSQEVALGRACQPFVTVIPILLTSKPKVNQALFMACLRCIRCCETFILVLINTLGHPIASYYATVVSHEVARGPSCHRTLTLSSSVSLSTYLGLTVQTLFMACLRCIRCCKTFIVAFINTLGHFVASYFATGNAPIAPCRRLVTYALVWQQLVVLFHFAHNCLGCPVTLSSSTALAERSEQILRQLCCVDASLDDGQRSRTSCTCAGH